MRAIVLLFVLLAGGVAAPVSGAVSRHVSCGMECCQESGECCCLEMRLAINDVDVGSDEDVRIDAWQKQCASNCATAVLSTGTVIAQAGSIPASLGTAIKETLPVCDAQFLSYDFQRLSKSSPRAPPFRF